MLKSMQETLERGFDVLNEVWWNAGDRWKRER